MIFHKKLQPKLFFSLFLVLFWTIQIIGDSLTLVNGDKLTGKIQYLSNKKILLKTSYAGTLEINWSMLDLLKSDDQFDVEVETGRLYRGKIFLSEGRLKITSNQKKVLLAQDLIIGITPQIEEQRSSWQRVDGNLDLGYNLTRGNAHLNQSSLLANGEYKYEDYKITGDLASIFSRQDNADATSRQSADVRFDWFVNPQLFRFFLGSFEHNDQQQLNFRTTLGGGLGRTLIKRKNTELYLLGGVTFMAERFRQNNGTRPSTTGSGESLTGLDLRADLFGWALFTSTISALPNLNALGQYRLEYDSTLRFPLFKNLSWSVSFYDRFISNPPTTVKKNDYGLISSFGIGF